MLSLGASLLLSFLVLLVGFLVGTLSVPSSSCCGLADAALESVMFAMWLAGKVRLMRPRSSQASLLRKSLFTLAVM